ncbi:MAG: DUF2460 domain-containing protein [Proteobacteria bacterium]|nr:DUF2460 domain-containing protein [Pseudomonadota bacterium]
MSNDVYPTLPGLSLPVGRSPTFKTSVLETASGREFRSALMFYPRVKYTLRYEFLRDSSALAEFRTLCGFYNSHRGPFDSWLFDDPDDNWIGWQVIGIGNGATRSFQLVRALGGFVEPIYDTHSVPQIYVDGVLKTPGTHYTINATGLVTFVAAPAVGATITYTGTYYWRCRFLDDHMDLERFAYSFWQLGKVEFKVVKP